MTQTKYGDCIKYSELIRDVPYYLGKSLVAHDGELNTDCSIGYHCIGNPMSFPHPHAHDFPEMLCFIGGDPANMLDLGAEVEFTIGEEGEEETHVITSGAIVSIPANVRHCPIVFTRVDRPLVFLEVSLTRIWKPEGPPPEDAK